jgi:glycosyltransferase 2 family protein
MARSGLWGIRAWIGILVSVAFLALLFWRVDRSEVLEALRGVEVVWFLPAAVLLAAALWVRAMRWRTILRPSIEISTADAGSLVIIGYAANNVLPMRTGEVVRALLLRRRHGGSSMTALGTIVAERIFDGLVLALLLAITIGASGGTGTVRWLALLMGLAFAGATLLLLVLAMPGADPAEVARRLLGFAPGRARGRVHDAADRFLGGLTQLRGFRAWSSVLFLSVLSWVLEAACYWMVGLAFGLDLDAHIYLAIAAAANLAIAAPSTAGGIGPYEFFAREVAVYFGVATGLATAYALVLHLFVLLPVALAGLFLLWRQHLGMGTLVRPQESLGSLGSHEAPDDDGTPDPDETVRGGAA